MAQKVNDKLSQRGHAFSLVLNDNGANVFKNEDFIKNRMLSMDYFEFVAVIKHDRDIDEEDTTRFKTLHYHVVLVLKYCDVLMVKTLLNAIVDKFNCNANQVTIEKVTDICMVTRYLIHIDNPDKAQYLPFDIATNNQLLVGRYLSMNPSITCLEQIIEITKRFHYDIESIACNIGEKNWKKYGYFVLQLKRDKF